MHVVQNTDLLAARDHHTYAVDKLTPSYSATEPFFVEVSMSVPIYRTHMLIIMRG